MDYKNLIPKIFSEIKKTPTSFQLYRDLFSVCRSIESEDFETAHSTNIQMRSGILRAMKGCDFSVKESFFDLYQKSLLFDAPHFFDAYALYIEINRKPEERFYQPRRQVLKPLVDALQDLADDRLDELFMSLPPRIGKTTLLMFYITWLVGRDSERTNLYSAYSSMITDGYCLSNLWYRKRQNGVLDRPRIRGTRASP